MAVAGGRDFVDRRRCIIGGLDAGSRYYRSRRVSHNTIDRASKGLAIRASRKQGGCKNKNKTKPTSHSHLHIRLKWEVNVSRKKLAPKQTTDVDKTRHFSSQS